MADLKHMRIPGIDMLSSIGEHILDSPHLLTCKYGSSAAHVMEREQVMSETSDWEQQNAGDPTDLTDRRGALAVQMALGVTTIASYYNWREFETADVRKLMDFAPAWQGSSGRAYTQPISPCSTLFAPPGPTTNRLTRCSPHT
jgi:hypothetical protein